MLSSERWPQFVNDFLKQEGQTYKEILDHVLPNVYINIARNIQEEFNNLDELLGKKIGLSEVIGYLAKTVQGHLPHIQSRIHLIDEAAEGAKKKRN